MALRKHITLRLILEIFGRRTVFRRSSFLVFKLEFELEKRSQYFKRKYLFARKLLDENLRDIQVFPYVTNYQPEATNVRYMYMNLTKRWIANVRCKIV